MTPTIYPTIYPIFWNNISSPWQVRKQLFILTTTVDTANNVEEDRLDLRVAWGPFYVHYSVVDIRIQMVWSLSDGEQGGDLRA